MSYSIIGTPLRSSECLIIGSNWGGKSDDPSQNKMPLHNDILCFPESPTYKGIIDFFMEVFDNKKLSVIDFLNTIVYTNANFIRTSNEDEDRKNLEKGFEITNKYLKQIITYVSPKIIICFGNSKDGLTATRGTLSACDYDQHIISEKTQRSKTSNRWNTYRFPESLFLDRFEIFSFPHTSKYNIWGKNIQYNPIFQDLKKKLKIICK